MPAWASFRLCGAGAIKEYGPVDSANRWTAIAQALLWGISEPQSETGAAGTVYFEPGGVFLDLPRPAEYPPGDDWP